MQPLFLKAQWRNLIMANYEVDPAVLLPYLPAFTELDEWEGRYYVSLVGFMFLQTRVKGISFPFHRNFEEVNLRFYVRHYANGEWKRGVVFVKELVPRRLISLVANAFYGEKYQALPMRNMKAEHADGSLDVEYAWKAGFDWDILRASALPHPALPVLGSEEDFITQHYWGYSKLANGRTIEYQVDHPVWRVYQIGTYNINVSGEKLYGKALGEMLAGRPASVFMAEGSEVLVRQGKALGR